jgi:hypothetical protein
VSASSGSVASLARLVIQGYTNAVYPFCCLDSVAPRGICTITGRTLARKWMENLQSR